MKILIAEDEPVSRKILERNLLKWGYEVIVACDGNEALRHLENDRDLNLAILDWMMPEKDGIAVCKEVRASGREAFLYIILLTAKGKIEDVVTGLESGADDYIVKPFDRTELKARVRAGERMVKLETSLRSKIIELKQTMESIKELKGIIPICAWCKKIRNDQEYWEDVGDYIKGHSKAEISHIVCPECLQKIKNGELELAGEPE
ncbi:MAG: response regulator [candidate division Zixibacteria bacterium]|nr:response regulator [candidate division Zixibacteria bacterium]